MSDVKQFPAKRIHRIPVNLPTGPGAPWTAAEVAAWEADKAPPPTKRTPLAIERLAMAICWGEFPSRPEGKTEHSYWREIAEDARDVYRRDAYRLAYTARNIGWERFCGRIGTAVLHVSPNSPVKGSAVPPPLQVTETPHEWCGADT